MLRHLSRVNKISAVGSHQVLFGSDGKQQFQQEHGASLVIASPNSDLSGLNSKKIAGRWNAGGHESTMSGNEVWLSQGRQRSLFLFLRTLRYLKFSQIYNRASRIVRRRWWRLTGKPTLAGTPVAIARFSPLCVGLEYIADNATWNAERDAAISKGQQAAKSEFCFLGHRVQYHDVILWNDPDQSQLWRYHLHYFAYLQDLMLWASCVRENRRVAYEAFKKLTTSWIEAHRDIRGDGWHPYTISLRLVHWIEAAGGFADELDDDTGFKNLIFRSIHAQILVLDRDQELDVRGNHLIENLRALIWAGVICNAPESERWLKDALSRLRLELDEQIQPDGGHFERCPGYHVVVLKALLDIACRLRASRHDVPDWLDAALARMLRYLWAILPPDGQVPLLKDTAIDAAPAPSAVLSAGALYFNDPAFKTTDNLEMLPILLFGKAGFERFKVWPVNEGSRVSTALVGSGHFVFRSPTSQDYAIFDAGAVCPDYLPAHAHADLFTYELLLGGRKVVVDSGVYQYSKGNWRDYFRSTRAHNTVEVEGENQSEVWSSFRVARRARPESVKWIQGSGFDWAQGIHHGYRRLKARVSHRRTFATVGQGVWIVLDELQGQGQCTAKSFIHLHPDLSIGALIEGAFPVMGMEENFWIQPFGEDTAEQSCGVMDPLPQGWYSERFGELNPNMVLSLCRTAELPFAFGYVLSRRHPTTTVLESKTQNTFCVLELNVDGQDVRVSSDPAAPVVFI